MSGNIKFFIAIQLNVFHLKFLMNNMDNINNINTIRLRNLRQQCFRLKRRRAGLREPLFVRKSEKMDNFNQLSLK